MPKKRSKETSPEYGSFIVTMLYNAIGIMSARGENPFFSKLLYQLANHLPLIPEIQQQLLAMNNRVKELSDSEFDEQIHQIKSELVRMCLNLYGVMEPADLKQQRTEEQKVEYVLEIAGSNQGIDELVDKMIRLLFQRIDVFVNGSEEEKKELFRSIEHELIEDNPEQAIKYIRFTLEIAGGETLINGINEALNILYERLFSSPVFSAVIEIVEKHHKKDSQYVDFAEGWKSLEPFIMDRIRKRGLVIPRVDLPENINTYDYNVERIFAMGCVFSELYIRATEKPFQFILDFMEGKIPNSMVIAVEHDLIDEMRTWRTQKRGGDKVKSIEETDKDYLENHAVNKNLSNPLKDLIDNEEMNEIFECLSEVERDIVYLLMGGFTQTKIATLFNRSQSWVSGKMKIIREKIRNRLSESDRV